MASPPRKVLSALKGRFPRTAEIVRNMRPSVRKMRTRLSCLETEEVFDLIYKERLWGSGSDSRSGGGSAREITVRLEETLPAALRELGVRNLLDAPCGDFQWMQRVDRSGLDSYIGADIVSSLVEGLQETHGDAKHRFIKLDLTKDDLPETDLILCRDCLIHLPNAMVRQVLDNVRRSSCRYLMTTSFPDTTVNFDVYIGGMRALNLRRPPYALPEPIREIEEISSGGGRRVLGVWEREQLG